MRASIRKGLGFGMTSGIITTLGLMVGLHSTTQSALVVMGGVLIIAVSDALSDALGIHVSEEFENKHSQKEIWEATIATFLCKFVFALSFIVPILLFPLQTAILASVAWGLSLITIFSFYMAKQQKVSPHWVIAEHLAIAIFVILVTHFIGGAIGALAVTLL